MNIKTLCQNQGVHSWADDSPKALCCGVADLNRPLAGRPKMFPMVPDRKDRPIGVWKVSYSLDSQIKPGFWQGGEYAPPARRLKLILDKSSNERDVSHTHSFYTDVVGNFTEEWHDEARQLLNCRADKNPSGGQCSRFDDYAG